MFKRILYRVAWFLYLTVLLPQLFVMTSYRHILWYGPQRWLLVRELALTGLSISIFCAPFLLLLQIASAQMLKRHLAGFWIFSINAVAGILLISGWNQVVFASFTLGMVWWPMLLCLLVSVGGALAVRLFHTHLGGIPLPAPVVSEADVVPAAIAEAAPDEA